MMTMAPGRPVSTVLAALVAVVVLSACTRGDDAQAPTPALPSTPDALPAVSVEGYNDILEQLRGIPVVVNLWASWCEPCKAETPKLVQAAADHPDVQFLGVNALDSRDGAESFIAEHAVTYPSVFDPSGAIKTDLNSNGLPMTVFYRADGTIEASVPAELSQATLDQNLAAIQA